MEPNDFEIGESICETRDRSSPCTSNNYIEICLSILSFNTFPVGPKYVVYAKNNIIVFVCTLSRTNTYIDR